MKASHCTKSLLLSLIAASCLPGSAIAESVQTRIDWSKFSERLDPASKILPAKFAADAFRRKLGPASV